MSYIFVPLDKEHRIMNWLNTFNNDECVFMNPKENNDSMWKFACRVVKKYEADKDIVIAWQFIYGVYIYMASRFYRKRVKIIALNFIEHSVGWKAKVKALLYNRCFANKNFYTGINCIEYLKEYKKYYKIYDDRVLEMPDCNFRTDIQERSFDIGDGTIFCGGFIRDWKTFFNAAKLLPHLNFVAVIRNVESIDKNELPENVRIYGPMPIAQFYVLLRQCSISVIALPSSVPNGFTVMIQSAYLNRPIIATDCVAVNKLLYNQKLNKWGGATYKQGDAKDLADKIEKLYADIESRKAYCEVMLENVKERSAEAYSDRLLKFADKIIADKS